MLTGTQGVSPGYDPLAYAVAEAHARGLELHAWINPFRAGNTADTLKFAPMQQFVARRDLLRIYGTQVWFDPGRIGLPALRGIVWVNSVADCWGQAVVVRGTPRLAGSMTAG